jgi:hypothetical protein
MQAVLMLAFLFVPVAAVGPLESCHRKFTQIESGRARGTVVTVTSPEINAFVAQQAVLLGKGAIRNTRVDLWQDHGRVAARIDLVSLAELRGRPLNWFFATMFAGERQVIATTKLVSVQGRARVDLEKLEVEGHVLDGRPLQFLIDEFVLPEYPDARIGQWFPLSFGIRTIRLSAGQVAID